VLQQVRYTWGAKLQFQLDTGKATINILVELKNTYKMLVTEGEIIYDPRELRGSWS